MTPGYRLRFRWRSSSVTLRTCERRLFDALGHIYGPFVTERSAPEDPVAAPSDAGEAWRAKLSNRLYTYDDFDDAAVSLEFEIERRLLKDLRAGTLLHAGAVADGRRTIILAGSSGAGKTTITLDFARRGFRYLTDEFVALSDDGASLYPFPRAATLKQPWPHAKEGEVLEVCEDWDYRGFYSPAASYDMRPVSLDRPEIIFLERKDGAPTARRLDNHEKLAGLITSTFELVGREEIVWPALSSLAMRATACKLEYRSFETDLCLALEALER